MKMGYRYLLPMGSTAPVVKAGLRIHFLIKRESFDETSSTIKVMACQGLNILCACVGLVSPLLLAVQLVGRLPTPHLILCFTPPRKSSLVFYRHIEGEASEDPVVPAAAGVPREVIVPVDVCDVPVFVLFLEGYIMLNLNICFMLQLLTL